MWVDSINLWFGAFLVTPPAVKVAFIYIIVSIISSILNICVQAFALWTYQDLYKLELSVLIGTAAGAGVKYFLEKKYVFEFTTENLFHDTRLFIQYTVMGMVTTFIFWGIEFAFHRMFGTDVMRYLGGAIGLTFGSYIKYHLDKRFVFKRELA
jgi:putative flippase GtrA